MSPFTFFSQYNLLEFKSSSDLLTKAEYKRIIARAYLYMAEEGVDNPSLITVYAVTSGKPVKVLKGMPELVNFSNISFGLYKSDNFPFYVLVIGELAIEERNYPLLLFSKGKKRKAFIRTLVSKEAMEYLRLAYELYPQEVMEVFSSMSKDFPTLEENIRFIVKDLGLERIAQAIPAEQKKILLRALVEQLGAKEVESILRNGGKKRSR